MENVDMENETKRPIGALDEKKYSLRELAITSSFVSVIVLFGLTAFGGYGIQQGKGFLALDPEQGSGIIDAQSQGTTAPVANPYTQETLVTGIVERANPAVVTIVVSKNVPVLERYYREFDPFGDGGFFRIPELRQNGTREQEVGGGTGFIVSSGGLVVTNKHVVDDSGATYTAFTSNGQKYEVKVVARDPTLDVAVLQLTGTAPGGGFPYLQFGDSDALRLGQSAIAIGNALGEFRNSVSVGVISGLSRSIVAGSMFGEDAEQLENVIQTDAAINSGNSGGPLLDLRGKVIGVNVAVAAGAQNVGFALPSNMVKNIVNSVQQYGVIKRPYLGVRYTQVNAQIAAEEKLPVDYGAYIIAGEGEAAVVSNSPAAKAGLKEGDIIVAVGGTSLKDQSLSGLMSTLTVGQSVTIEYMRGNEKKTATVTLEQLPNDL